MHSCQRRSALHASGIPLINLLSCQRHSALRAVTMSNMPAASRSSIFCHVSGIPLISVHSVQRHPALQLSVVSAAYRSPCCYLNIAFSNVCLKLAQRDALRAPGMYSHIPAHIRGLQTVAGAHRYNQTSPGTTGWTRAKTRDSKTAVWCFFESFEQTYGNTVARIKSDDT